MQRYEEVYGRLRAKGGVAIDERNIGEEAENDFWHDCYILEIRPNLVAHSNFSED